MSSLRPGLQPSSKPVTVRGDTAYLVIYGAVKDSDGLIHGRLHDNGNSCAIGCYFRRHEKSTLAVSLIDEVAAVNDSVPKLSPKKRREFVLRWLRWKLSVAGVPGFHARKAVKS